MPDTIHLQGLRVAVRLGVPEKERSQWQTVEVDLTLTPEACFRSLNDDLERTVDYGRVAESVREVAAEEPRRLLETLAEVIAERLLTEYALSELALSVRKFIVPGASWVGVSIRRSR